MKIALIVIFNHRYEGNLPLLRTLYQKRFEHVVFLMPFADDLEKNEDDIVSVHSGSFTFQGHLGEAKSRIGDLGCDAYLVIGDDVFLNPKLDQNNLHSSMGLDRDAAYTKCLANLYEAPIIWGTTGNRITFSALVSNDLEWRKYFPLRDDALKKLGKYGFNFRPLGLRNFRNQEGKFTLMELRMLIGLFAIISPIRNVFSLKTKEVPYPLLYGYSDFFIVPQSAWGEFLHLCQVTAAMKIFVESAIPTSLALACDKVETEIPYGLDHHSEKRREEFPLKGVEFQWTGDSRNEFEKKYEYSLSKLISDFPEDVLYFHPVKLSKWK